MPLAMQRAYRQALGEGPERGKKFPRKGRPEGQSLLQNRTRYCKIENDYRIKNREHLFFAGRGPRPDARLKCKPPAQAPAGQFCLEDEYYDFCRRFSEWRHL